MANVAATRKGGDMSQTGHRPARPDYGTPAHMMGVRDGTANNDVLDNPRLFTGFTDYMRPVVRRLRQVTGDPDATLTIYRAQASRYDTIREGDWVTLSLDYARSHALYDDDLTVVSATVRAGDVIWAMDDLMEWGYWGDDVKAERVDDV